MADYESIAGVDSGYEMAALIERQAAENAEGWALYGNGGLFNDQRKALLSACALEIRDAKRAAGEKVTEAELDQLAHVHPRYTAFLDKHTTARAEWYVQDSKLTTLHQRVARGNRVLDFAARIG